VIIPRPHRHPREVSPRGIAPEPTPESSQVYHWPAVVARLGWALPAVSLVLFAAGLYFVATSVGLSDIGRMTGGLLTLLVGAVGLGSLVSIHLCLAREVLFTRDAMIVRQTGRRPLRLPYCGYQHDWVADTSTRGSIRLIVFRQNRGCTVLAPPAWFEDAVAEIARIQQEEGWYAPLDAGVAAGSAGRD
jgi:hypothetical protein